MSVFGCPVVAAGSLVVVGQPMGLSQVAARRCHCQLVALIVALVAVPVGELLADARRRLECALVPMGMIAGPVLVLVRGLELKLVPVPVPVPVPAGWELAELEPVVVVAPAVVGIFAVAAAALGPVAAVGEFVV